MTLKTLNLDLLAQVIRDEGRPVHINKLTRSILDSQAETTSKERAYVPGARYEQGEKIWFNHQPATVKAVSPGQNPKQGKFTVLTLLLPDGTEKKLAAEVVGASANDQITISGDGAKAAPDAQKEATIRAAIQEALRTDNRFVWYQNSQGDHYCLAEMLPQVDEDALKKVADVLTTGEDNGQLISRTTEELVLAVWSTGDDGTASYALRAFALGWVLLGFSDVAALGDRWVWSESWRAFTSREVLTSPHMATRIEVPEDVPKVSEADLEREAQQEAKNERDEPTASATSEQSEDLESWRLNRSKHTVFTLNARHYYEGWLPLTNALQRLFPPLVVGRQQIIFHHQFGDQPEFFPAWVDRSGEHIWLSPQMYDTLRNYKIYPGARLRISARNEQEYELATRPPNKTDPIRVWRMWLEEGEIQFDDDQEPRQYEIDDDVFVADVRFEDRAALFQQAAEVGNSIFGLMYKQALEWWRANGRQDLTVTVDELFRTIHYPEKGRMTSKATIAWELWRRLAFKSIGGGKYLFRPQFEARIRSIRSGGSTSTAVLVQPKPGFKSSKRGSLLKAIVEKKTEPTSIPNLEFAQDEAFLMGLILGRGEIDREAHTVHITLSYGRYKNGIIVGGSETVVLDEAEVLPGGVHQVYDRVKHFIEANSSASHIDLDSSSIYHHRIILDFRGRDELFERILDWYPVGSNWHTFTFPKAKIDSLPEDLVREFMRGAASILGFITDNTRAGPNGRHRVFITYSRENKQVLNDIREVLELRMHVTVPHIHWHEGWDPQMRVYAEDFEKVGFWLYWKDEILKASAHKNREMTDPRFAGQMAMFD